MRLVYVAGPFRALNPDGTQDAWKIHNNVIAAMGVALEVWKAGHVAICPHANTFCFQNASGCSDDVWLEGDLAILERCDALVTSPGWENSKGTQVELAFANKFNIPVFHDVTKLLEWLNAS